MAKIDDQLLNTLRKLLVSGTAGTQENIMQSLEKKGFIVNQSKVSRLLRRLGAAKTTASNGSIVYCLPKEPIPSEAANVADLVRNIDGNAQMLVIHTVPGAANLVSRLIDYHLDELYLLGCIAGDDTIFAMLKSDVETQAGIEHLSQFIFG